MHHTEGHYPAIWHCQCAGQYQCLGTLHVGSCPHTTGARSQVASSSGTGSSRVPVCLCNLSAHAVEVPIKAMIGQVVPANQILLMLCNPSFVHIRIIGVMI